ncbi:MAG: hypothetical protein HYS23_15710 [Geobacter sp.]|nr:hypothetical protein [Geobacter sp.]
MPELPEVETTRRRLEPLVVGKKFEKVVMRAPKLRLPMQKELKLVLPGRIVRGLGRRRKYLLFYCDGGCLVIHLGPDHYLLSTLSAVKEITRGRGTLSGGQTD